MADGIHVPQTPSWQCLRCGKDWPCGPGREWLVAGAARTELSVLAWGIFFQAAEDLPDVPASALHDRFVRWTWTVPSG